MDLKHICVHFPHQALWFHHSVAADGQPTGAIWYHTVYLLYSLSVQMLQQDFSSFVAAGLFQLCLNGHECVLHFCSRRFVTAVQEAAEKKDSDKAFQTKITSSEVIECTHWPAEQYGSSVDINPTLHFICSNCVHQYPGKPLWEGGERGMSTGRRKARENSLIGMWVSSYLPFQHQPVWRPALLTILAPSVLLDARPCEATEEMTREWKPAVSVYI